MGANTPWLPLERICAQYGFRFFWGEKSKSVLRTDALHRVSPTQAEVASDATTLIRLIFNSVPARSKIKCAAGTLRAYLRRRTDDAKASFVSSRSLAARGSWGTAPSVFWFLLYAQKERPGGEPYRFCTLQNQCPAARRPQSWPNISFTYFSS